MATEPRTIRVTPDLSLDRLLSEASDEPVLLDRDGVLYSLRRIVTRSEMDAVEDEDIWANYDPERARRALEATAGVWSDIDADALIRDLYRWREEGSRPPDRPKWPT